ncbi:hypothetical protein S245_068977, partial [Arachis hypogaea]
LPPPSPKRASKPPSLSCSSVLPSCSYCFSFESTVAQLCSIVAGAISVPPVIPLVVPLSPSCLGSALLCSRKVMGFESFETKCCTWASLRFFRHQSQFGTLSHPNPFLFPITLSYTTDIDAIKDRPHLLYSIRNLQNLDSALHLFHKMVSVNPLPSVKDFNLLFSSIVKMKHYTAAISLIKHFFSLELKSNICTLNIV